MYWGNPSKRSHGHIKVQGIWIKWLVQGRAFQEGCQNQQEQKKAATILITEKTSSILQAFLFDEKWSEIDEALEKDAF
jgi:hypothetical protein